MAGSRRGDQRVPAFWVSEGRPKLGWCWDRNPHTWLGTASCAGASDAGSRRLAGSELGEHAPVVGRDPDLGDAVARDPVVRELDGVDRAAGRRDPEERPRCVPVSWNRAETNGASMIRFRSVQR